MFRLGVVPLLSMLALPVSAQTTGDRAFLDSVATIAARPASCAGRETSVTRLCEGFVALRRADGVAKARDLFERVLLDHADWPRAWYGLGLARVRAAQTGLRAREAPLHPVGVSNEVGAGNALVRALELDGGHALAAEALAAISLPREGASRLAERLRMLRTVRGTLSAAGLYGLADVELEAGTPDGAAEALHRALDRRGVDSGLVLLRLARAEYRAGRADAGREALLLGAATSSPASTAAYRRELAWVATPTELAAWDSLTGPVRRDWLAAFWAGRELADGQRDGARLVEHYGRLEYAWAHYRLTLPPSGRHRSSLAGMSLDGLEQPGFDARAGLELPEEQRAAMLAANAFNVESGLGALTRSYVSLQALLDDRGVVYVRHGRPDDVVRPVGGTAIELWRYRRTGEPLLVSFREEAFDGQVGASAIVPSLLAAHPALRDQLCHLDQTLCSATGGVELPGQPGMVVREAMRTTPAQRTTAIRQGVARLDEATTTDRFERRFERPLHPVVQAYGLTGEAGTRGLALVAFALPAHELVATTPPEAGGRTVYAVRIEAMFARRRDGARTDIDTVRRFATARPLGAGEYLTGQLLVPLPEGTHAATVVLSQDDRGAAAHLGALAACARATTLCLSDLILGVDPGPLRGVIDGARTVPLNPLNAYARGGTAELTYQVVGATRDRYETVVELFDATDATTRDPRLTIRFEDRPDAAIASYHRRLGLQNLPPGRYRLRLTMTGDGRRATAVGWLTIRD